MKGQKPRILVVEDEESLLDAIAFNLEMEGHEVFTARDGEKALEMFHERRYDLIVLDIMLPYLDGLTVCQRIRATNDRTPIIFLTAKNADKDRVKGLKLGGDDYLGKPFDLEELLLRVSKLLERHQQERSPKDLSHYAFGGNKVDLMNYEAHGINGKKPLSRKECMLLKLLIDRQDEVLSREEILDSVWGYDQYPSSRTIDNFILGFRKCFEEDPRHPRFFHSVRGVGYRFSPEGDEHEENNDE